MAKQSAPGKKKRPSMNDVAKLAGVSQTTVSFVLNNVEGSNIPPRTQERVWAAVKELGYRPNAIARGLRSRRTHTIGFVTDRIATTPYAVRILEGAQELAWANGYLLMLVNTGGDQHLKRTAIDMMLERQVEGIIYATMYHRPVTLPANMHELPAVLLDCYVEDRAFPSVVPDEVQGGRAAVEILLEKGYRRIGFVQDNNPVPAAVGRLKGLKQALEAYGVPFDETLVQTAESIPAGGYQATMALMRLPHPPTAIFCYNDRMALGAYNALRDLNLTIPDDVAVMGFDNQELIAADLSPPLSTMALPHYEMGRWAVQHLLELIEQPELSQQSTSVQHLMECPFIERESI
jgi:LacI family transcriptional regulator